MLWGIYSSRESPETFWTCSVYPVARYTGDLISREDICKLLLSCYFSNILFIYLLEVGIAFVGVSAAGPPWWS